MALNKFFKHPENIVIIRIWYTNKHKSYLIIQRVIISYRHLIIVFKLVRCK